MPTTAMAVTVAANAELRPRRVAIKSAMEVVLSSRAKRNSLSTTGNASTYSAMVPKKVGGSAQPESRACCTVPMKVQLVQYTASDRANTTPQWRFKVSGWRSPHTAAPNNRPSHTTAAASTKPSFNINAPQPRAQCERMRLRRSGKSIEQVRDKTHLRAFARVVVGAAVAPPVPACFWIQRYVA